MYGPSRTTLVALLALALALGGLFAHPMTARAATPPQPIGIGLYNAAGGAPYQAQLAVLYSLPDGSGVRVDSDTFSSGTGGWVTIPANAVNLLFVVQYRAYYPRFQPACTWQSSWAVNTLMILDGTYHAGLYCRLGNYKPTVLTDQSSVTVNAGQTATMSGKVADPDGDAVTLSATAGTVTNNGNGAWSWSYPTTEATQNQMVTVTGSDPRGQSWTTSFDLVVNSNTAPTVAANQSSVSVDEGQTATNTGTVADADGDAVALAASAGTVTNNGDGTWSWSDPTSDGPAQSQTVTITADDGHGHTATATFALTVSNAAPTVTSVTAPSSPQLINSPVAVSGAFSDPGTLDTHTATWDWGDGSTSAGTVTEANGAGTVSDSHSYTAAGLYTVKLTVTDKDGGVGALSSQSVVVVDPSGGSVSGRGTIDSPAGACRLTSACASATGPAKFSFTAQYKKGATVPTGSIKFQFQAGNLTFQSTSYQWLIVDASGTSAQLTGAGTVNGAGNATFTVWATDGSPDTLRIQIADGGGNIAYDNGTQQALASGSIAIRK